MTRTKGFRPKTNHEFGSNELFDKDISGLHKIVKPKKILTKTVRYIEPSLAQVPYMMNFMIEAFADLIMSAEEMSKKDRNEIFCTVVEFVVQTSKDIDSEDESKSTAGEQILGSAFGSKAAIQYLFPVMQQCFPDLSIYRLTNECFIQCFNALFSDLFMDTEEISN